jgi:carbamoyl-phosphate synthase large subunit
MATMGLKLIATSGTRAALLDQGLTVDLVLKVHEGRPNIEDAIKNNEIQLIINTPAGSTALEDDRSIRRTALAYKVPIITTIAGAKATAAAIQSLQQHPLQVKSLQEYIGMGA